MSTSEIFLNYTDLHNVDEDLTAISLQGGSWYHDTFAGAALRSIDNISSGALDVVASKKK